MSDKIRATLELRLCDNDDDWNPLVDFLRWNTDYLALAEHSKIMLEVETTTVAHNWSQWDDARNMIVRNLDQNNALNVRVHTFLHSGQISIQIPPGDWIKITNWNPNELVEFTSSFGTVSYLAMVW